MPDTTDLVLSAVSREALMQALAGGNSAPVAGPHRLVILAGSGDDLAAKRERAQRLLESQPQARFNADNAIFYGCTEGVNAGRIAFLFPGFGTRHTRMLGELLERFAYLRHWFGRFSDEERERLTGEPEGLFALVNSIMVSSLAMYEVLTRCGVACSAMAGHSYGENAMLAAAGIAGGPAPVLRTLRRIARAGYDAFKTSPAVDVDMLALASKAARDLPYPLTIAVDNCPQQTIVAGPRQDIARLEETVRARGEIAFRLPLLTFPVHTPGFPIALDILRGIYAEMDVARPRVTAYSCATAAPFPDYKDGDEIREILARQWSAPVRFRETIERLFDDDVRTFVEVGPGDRLAGFVRDTLRGRDVLAISTNQESRPAVPQLRIALAQLFVRGVDVDFAPLRESAVEQQSDAAVHSQAAAPESAALPLILAHTASVLGLTSPELLDPHCGFFELGLTSLDCVELADRLAQPQTIVFDYPTPARLAQYLSGTAQTRRVQRESSDSEPIAIVGIGCRFPGGADTPAAYWQLLEEGRDAVIEVPPQRWISSDAPRFGGFLREPVDGLDRSFFGISPREATTLDPQQRLLLEVAVEALENAAIDAQSLAGTSAGVFVGISSNDYAQRLTPSQRLNVGSYLATGNSASTAAGRLSFFLGANGPSLAVDTACSSSLVAVHLAVKSLRGGESDLALAGGVNLMLSPETGTYLSRAHALSPGGRCRTFDASADGYVRAEGCGMAVLKRLSDARAAGDRVLAVITGSAINHDGRTSGLTVPNGLAQQDVIERALADAGVRPAQISYIEAHGTGTALGDPIEVQALGRIFRTPVILGAAKTNVGHLEAAAGIAGLIKVVLQLQHRRVPGVLHFERPNPKIMWDSLPFAVARTITPWDGGHRIAGVSSFGISGTNAHVIVEEASDAGLPEGLPPGRPLQVLTLSAQSREALATAASRLAGHVEATSDAFPSVAFTTNIGRAHYRYRRAVVSGDVADAAAQLRRPHRGSNGKAAKPPRVAFLFTGQGSQYPGMARELFEGEPLFRRTVEECDAIVPVIRLLDAPDLHQTVNAQPALFAIEYALAVLWRSWGIEPAAVMGHSVGEFVAACVAGVFTMADALRLVAARGRLMQSLPAGGAMLAVHAAEGDLDLHNALDLAAVNGPRSVVLSGPAGAIAAAEARWRERGVRTTRLTVSHAFHSSLMEPIVESFRAEAARVRMQQPSLPMIANLTGRRADASIATAGAWAAQLRAPVRFADGIRALADEGCDVFLEIGPRPVLIAMGQESAGGEAQWLASIRPPVSDMRQMLETLAALYEAGAGVDWRAFHHGREQRRVSIPTYPFQRERFWIEAQPESAAPGDSDTLRGQRISLPDADEVRFESRISASGVLGGLPNPMPAAGTIAIIGMTRIDDLAVFEPLVLEPAPVAVHTVIRGEQCRVFFRSGTDWRLHAEAHLPAGAEPAALQQHEIAALHAALQTAGDATKRIDGIRLITLHAFPGNARTIVTADSVALVDDDGQPLVNCEGIRFVETRRRTFREKLLEDVPEREARIRRYVAELTATILHMPHDQTLDLDVPLTDLGFDSLLSLQFVNAVQAETGVTLNIATLIEGGSLASLAAILLDRFATSTAGAAKTALSLVPRAAGADAPLSYGQRALWFLWDLAPDSSAYNVTLTVPVDGDVASWRDACRRLVERHPMLGASFPRREPEPVTRIAAEPVLDWADAPSPAEAHREPFDLERGPVVRFRWCGAQRVLAITMHHIVTDGWSVEIIRRELAALRAGAVLPALQRTYADYVHWQRAMLDSSEGEQLLHFWREQLASPLPRLDLPADRQRPPLQTFHGASVSFTLPPSLRDLARGENATLNVVLLAAYFVLLHRLTGSDDIIAGVPTAGRPFAELTPIVGYFVDPLAVRARIDRGSTFRAFIGALRTIFAQAIEHRDFPFALLVEKLRVDRDPSRSPLFDVSFNFLGRHEGSDVPQSEGKFDLTLTVSESGDGDLAASFGYNTDLFDRETVIGFAAALTTIAASVATDPEQHLAAVPLQPAGSFEPVLRGLHIEDPPLIWDRFAAEANANPDAPAVTADGVTLTYRELHQRAIDLSIGGRHVLRLDATPSVEFVIGVLAALRAGIPYIPAGVRTPEEFPITEKGLAYVLYTSGSTGKPKGVAIGQRALANYVASIISDLDLVRGASYALVSTLTADLGNTMLFPSLCHGGHLHLLSEDEATNPQAFAEYLAVHAIDYVKIVPSHLAALTSDNAALPRKAVILGGEAASPAWCRRLQRAAPHCRFFNHYGPTETTIGVMTARLDDSPNAARSLPLRRAVANCDIYLLDDALQPVPAGVVGEICVAGAPLAHGYIGDPLESAKRFITACGVRLYRTGDLARMRSDGSLEVLGRADRQVKHHGVRIELGHIEAVLRDCDGVRQAATIVEDDRLVAFVVCNATDDELRERCARRLPRTMLPSQFVRLQAIPITTNGKTDYAALRRLLAGRPRNPVRQLPAADPVEQRLANLWSEVLDVNDVNSDADFFDLGGHSLLAVRLAGRITDAFGCRVPLATFFTHRTVRRLASFVRAAGSAASPLIVPMQPSGSRAPLFFFPGAGGSVLYFERLARLLGEEHPSLGVQGVGLDGGAPAMTVEETAARSLDAIRAAQPHGPYRFAGHSFGALVAYEIARRLVAAGEEVAFLGVIDNAAPDASAAAQYLAWGEREWLRHISTRIGKLYDTDVRADDEASLIEAMVAVRLLPDAVDRVAFRRFVSLYRANAMAAVTYAPPRAALPVRITLFRASEQDAELRAIGGSNDAALGWNVWTSERVHVIDIPGTHITMLTEPHVAHLGAQMRDAIEFSEARAGAV